MRRQIIGGSIGAAFVVGYALVQDGNHRIDASESVIYLWGATTGGLVGSAAGYYTGQSRCGTTLPAIPSGPHNCGAAAARGAAKGALIGGFDAFIVSPVIAFLVALPIGFGQRDRDLNRSIGVITAAGAIAGMPIGAYSAHHDCTYPQP